MKIELYFITMLASFVTPIRLVDKNDETIISSYELAQSEIETEFSNSDIFGG